MKSAVTPEAQVRPRLLPGGVPSVLPEGCYAVRGQGGRCFDQHGKEYRDFVCGYGAVILGHADIDRRVDVYAVGCVAYFLLTGERVFGAANKMTVLMRHVQEEPMPPSHRTKLQIPREVDEFVVACLRKDPKRRPASAEDLLQMASTCKTADVWDQQAARNWWETHLPHFATPAKANTLTQDVSTRYDPADKVDPQKSGFTTVPDNAITPDSTRKHP